MKSLNASTILTHKGKAFLLLATALALISGCSIQQTKDHDSSFYSIKPGSKLQQLKPLTIKAGLGRVYLQRGEIVTQKALDIYHPHCSLTVNTISKKPVTLNPTVYTIYKVVDTEEYASRNVLYASWSRINHDSGPSIIAYATYYYLSSESNKDVRTLECAQWDDPYNVEYLSINQIKVVLGEHFRLVLNE